MAQGCGANERRVGVNKKRMVGEQRVSDSERWVGHWSGLGWGVEQWVSRVGGWKNGCLGEIWSRGVIFWRELVGARRKSVVRGLESTCARVSRWWRDLAGGANAYEIGGEA